MQIDTVARPQPVTSLGARTMQDMLDTVLHAHDGQTPVRVSDGWRRCLPSGDGFHQDYDASIARGGWEFYRLDEGICITITDMVAACALSRDHCLDDQLAFLTMAEGSLPIHDPIGREGHASVGYCTVYGMAEQSSLHTLYEAGRSLRWISIMVDRHAFSRATRLEVDLLPRAVQDFIHHGGNLQHVNVPLPAHAAAAALQIHGCAYQGSFRRMFLAAKAREIVCSVLFAMSQHGDSGMAGMSFTAGDRRRLQHARELLEQMLEQPPSISELALRVGMSRQKLQHGFRLVYGDTVARIRDRLRMERALVQVRDTMMPMLDIALGAGYDYQASFTRAFKAAYGLSPMQLRRIGRANRR